MDAPISFFYHWQNIPDEMYPNVMREFHDNGVRNLVATQWLLERMIREPALPMSLKTMLRNTDMRFFEAHGICSTGNDLACTDRFRRPGMIADHKLAMGCAAELGCKTYVVHMGAYESVYFQTPNEELRPNVIEALEQLLPEAEKLGIVIALENSYEIANTPDEVLYYLRHFEHPSLACCLDVGHANVMAPGPGKSPDRYHPDVIDAWHGHVVQYDGALEAMAPWIVTMHLHDNNGFADQHNLPGTGTVDWTALAQKIKKLPRLISLQSEVKNGPSASWSIRKLCETFRKIFPDCPTA